MNGRLPPPSERQVHTQDALIELPFPAKILWPNGRGHWGTRREAVKKHRQWAHDAALAAGIRLGRFPERIHWSATFYPKTANKIDSDNAAASLKAYQDGIAEAMRVNDQRFDNPTIHFAEPVKNGKVVIRIGGEG